MFVASQKESVVEEDMDTGHKALLYLSIAVYYLQLSLQFNLPFLQFFLHSLIHFLSASCTLFSLYQPSLSYIMSLFAEAAWP